MKRLRSREGVSARALEFAILTAARSGEVMGATWGEMDRNAGVWTIPASRMKASKEHRVPLTEAAAAILRDMANLRSSDAADSLVFPGAKQGSRLSVMALEMVLRRMKIDATVHGFRSSFRDWAGEATAHPREVIEHALAHQLKDKAEAAYQRGDLFVKRRRLMEDWASFCDKAPASLFPLPLSSVEERQA
nr:site-specific integrase [Neoroseomonas alba]